ncbi:MAG: TonB-dependent receptor [Acidiphilium sp.]|nr:TonB-dependent receptor [Acidiphilium sp.]
MQIGSTRKRILLLTACSVASGMVFSARVWAQSAPAPVIVPATPDTGTGPIIPGGPVTPEAQAVHIAKIKKFYHELLLKEKNVSTAVSHIDKKQIEATGLQQGSIQSVLKQTPSVNEYQQNIGQGVPVLTVRGVRNSQLASTLNGLIPLQDLLSGGQGAFLNNNLGSPITLGQLESTTVYPGVAPPDKQGFATIGGTIAYESKKPTAKPYAEIFGGIGSFDSSNAGFEINTGDIGTGIDAPRAILRYNQSYTAGFPDNNSIRSGDMYFQLEKPYDEGLSHVSATVIYNRADGYMVTAPLPVPLQQANSYSYNFPHSLTYTRENNKYLTAILHDETYINPHLIIEASLFYLRQPTKFTSQQQGNQIAYNPAFPYQVTFQVPYFAYGPNFGPGNFYNLPGYFSYDPLKTFGSYTAGESAEINYGGTQTIGFTPRANIFLPHNDITIGGLFTKEMALSAENFVYGSIPMPQVTGYNSFSFGGGSQRTIYTVFAQDKVNLLGNKLHIEPGVQLTGVYSSAINAFSYSQASATNPTGNYKLQNYGKQADPYLGVTYDFPHDFVGYAEYGKGARYAPILDYGLGTPNAQGIASSTTAPKPEVVHAYTAGVRYDTPRFYLNLDTFYQKVTSQFSFYTNYQTGTSTYANTGASSYHGYEMSTKYRLTQDIELFGNASYTQAQYLNSFYANVTPFEGQFGYAFKGEPLAGIPNWLGNFGVEYDHGPITARLSASYTGQQFITYDFAPQLPANPLIAPPNPNSTLALATTPFYSVPQSELGNKLSGFAPIPQNFKLPAYFLANVYLSYKLPMHGYDHLQYLKFSLNVQNLLGLHYYQHYFLAPAELPQNGGFALTPTYASSYVGLPRSIFFNVTARF